MRSLFLRIFLSFWVAMGLILAVSVGIAATFIWNRTEALQHLDANELATAAEQRLNREGIDGLLKWMREAQRKNPGLDIFAVDANGRPLTKGPMPDFIQRRVRDMVRGGFMNGPAKRRDPPGDPRRSSPQITGPDGAIYTLFFPQAPWVPLSVLGTAPVQISLLTIALAISGAVCWYLGRYVTRPVERLQASARALAAGNLDARVGDEFADRRDELSVLAHDFDQMAERLRVLLASKEVLLRDVSHELRTPLARLRLALGLARREGADLNREHDRIEREAERLDELIGEVLHLSRLTTAQPTLAHEPFDFAQLISDLAEDARMEATAQNKSVSWDSPGALEVDGDQELLRRGIENVLRNAVRFTAAGSSVDLIAKRQGDKLALTVSDHGPGVPEEDLSRLFEPFYRVAQARERDSGGYGLGLAITAQVINLHGGSVVARNAPTGGLVVTMTIPLKPAQIKAAEAKVA